MALRHLSPAEGEVCPDLDGRSGHRYCVVWLRSAGTMAWRLGGRVGSLLQIPEEAKQATTNCRKSFSCLERDGWDLCRIRAAIHNEILFVDCLEPSDCSYQGRLGERTACLCPTRIAIYAKCKR